MKNQWKIFLLLPVITAVFLISHSFVSAADKVVVVPLGGTNVYIDPTNIVSAYHNWGTENSAATLLTVPANKHFVLTDIVGMADVGIFEDNTKRTHVRVGGLFLSSDGNIAYPNPITISSGIVFGPGSKVQVGPNSISSGLPNFYGYVTLSGYYY
jgi:hypothetical protein